MRIVLARLESLKAVALSNEGPDSNSARLIDKMAGLGKQIDIQLPAVLHPVEDPAAPEPAIVVDPVIPQPVVDEGGPEPVATADVPPTSTDGPGVDGSGGAVAGPADGPAIPVTDSPASVPPPSADTGSTGPVEPQPVEPAAAPVVDQVTDHPALPVSEPSGTGDVAVPAVDSSMNQSDPGDEDPTPADRETIESLDARLDAVEGHPRKRKS